MPIPFQATTFSLDGNNRPCDTRSIDYVPSFPQTRRCNRVHSRRTRVVINDIGETAARYEFLISDER